MQNKIEGTSSDPMTVRDTMANDFESRHEDDQIIAMFETRARAETARDELVRNGVDSGSINIIDRSVEDGRTPTAEDQGFWGAIKSLFVPDEDTYAYGEGVHRGHAMLVVRPRVGERDRVVHTLERLDPIDFDARLEEWRSAGWNGVYGDRMIDRPERLTTERLTTMREGAGSTIAPTVTPGMPGATPSAVTTGRAGMSSESVATSAEGLAGAGRVGGALGTEGREPLVERRDTTIAGNTADASLGADRLEADRLAAESDLARRENLREGEQVIPLAEERMRIGKRMVEGGGVRVRTYVVERPVEEQVNLRQERVDVERRAVDRPVSDLGEDAFRERTIEVTTTNEEPVVAKETRVREEVALRKEATERTETVRDTVRRTEVEVNDDRNQTLKRTDTMPGGTDPAKKI